MFKIYYQQIIGRSFKNISGGILIPDIICQGKYKVEPRRLIYGFGMLLKEEVLSRTIKRLGGGTNCPIA